VPPGRAWLAYRGAVLADDRGRDAELAEVGGDFIGTFDIANQAAGNRQK
jgi:hypothetical protein